MRSKTYCFKALDEQRITDRAGPGPLDRITALQYS